MGNMLANGEILVVETEDDRFLGSVEPRGEEFIIRSGFVGRPVIVHQADVMTLAPAAGHRDVITE
jgi:hypothetical protein